MYWIQQPEIVSQPKVGIKSHVINQIYMNSEHQLVSGLLYFVHIKIIKNIQHLSKDVLQDFLYLNFSQVTIDRKSNSRNWMDNFQKMWKVNFADEEFQNCSVKVSWKTTRILYSILNYFPFLMHYALSHPLSPSSLNTETPRLTRITGPGKNRVRWNRALRGYCCVVSGLKKLQNRVWMRNQS